MIPPLIAVLLLWAVHTFLPTSIRYLTSEWSAAEKLKHSLTSRDAPPPLTVYGERAERARWNLLESLVYFLPLALLLEVKGVDANAVMAAWAFFGFRIAYTVTYLFNVFAMRTVFFSAAIASIVVMASTLVT